MVHKRAILPLERFVKRYGRNTDVFNYLKLTFKALHVPCPYEKLSKTSLWNWFDDKCDLKPNFKKTSKLRHHVKHQKKNFHILEYHPHVKDQFVCKLEKLKKGGHTFLLSIVQPILRGMIEVVVR
jgi:hypothetical protein